MSVRPLSGVQTQKGVGGAGSTRLDLGLCRCWQETEETPCLGIAEEQTKEILGCLGRGVDPQGTARSMVLECSDEGRQRGFAPGPGQGPCERGIRQRFRDGRTIDRDRALAQEQFEEGPTKVPQKLSVCQGRRPTGHSRRTEKRPRQEDVMPTFWLFREVALPAIAPMP